MNWKDVPHLFANGKFRIKMKDRDGQAVPFTGCFNNILVRSFETTLFGETRRQSIYMNKDEHVLVARKIEDMTDEEKELHRSKVVMDIYDPLGKKIETPESFLYLLTIGILPKQFKTDNVIFTDE